MSRNIEEDRNYYKITAYNQRENFISTISHDLKIPVIAQMRALELLSDGSLGKLNSEQQEMIDLTLDSCRSIYDMLGAIIASYKYENREVPLNKSIISIEEIFKSILLGLKNILEAKNININLKLSANELFADKKQIKKAINNLLEYCLYSAQNNSLIAIKTEKYRENFQILIKFCPINTSSNKFENFSNGTNSLDKIGNKLNFYLAKQIIDSHNGEIKFSQKDKYLLILVKIYDQI